MAKAKRPVRSVLADDKPLGKKRKSLHRKAAPATPAHSGETAAPIAVKKDGTPASSVFPFVGIGASAGGLEAFTRLLQHLPVDTGMAFGFIQHLSPQHPSMLASLLSRVTAMPVMEVQHGTQVRPNCVYVIPPNTLMSIAGPRLELGPRPEERGAPRPIDHFFRSLAMDRKILAIGVVLSGADSDGALGLQAIRGEGGIAIVQIENSTRNPEMPRAAIAAGPVDLILSPEEIAGELARIGQHPALDGRTTPDDQRHDRENESQLNRLFALLRTATQVDFAGYKPGTIRRRIARRMVLKRHADLGAYVSYLESNPPEAVALCDDILINVTGFFRDPEAFEALENDILPRLLRGRSGDSPLRVWVPGCSTGEEVYSIAICLLESITKLGIPVPIQIFGTDLSERAIRIARVATYPEATIAKLTPERQARFFTRVENGYQVVKPVRDLIVFARQNLLVDPPFSRLDLISCRNVLIYLGSALQRRVIATFHYALQPEGYLMLGRSESLLNFPELFAFPDKQHKFYSKKAAGTHAGIDLAGRGFAREEPGSHVSSAPKGSGRSSELDLEKTAERLVLAEYAPAWVMVNENLELLHSRGDTSPYLQLPPGRPTFALLKIARESVRGELRKLLTQAKAAGSLRESAGVKVKEGGEIRNVRLEVRRISGRESSGGCFLVLFFPGVIDPALSSTSPSSDSNSPAAEMERLREELALTSQRLQSIIDERDAANQDLTTANEEIQSSNQELQSINEELETSKEELQSTNEELNTVNEELQNRNRELSGLSDDLANLLTSTTIPTVMVDNDLRIRRLTTAAEGLLNVRPSDIGRPLGDIRMALSLDDVAPAVRRVVSTLNAEDVEVQAGDGCWYVLRVRPCRTHDNRIQGAVLFLMDIDQVRRAELAANTAREFAESVVESLQTPLLVLRNDLRVRLANPAFFASYKLQPTDVENRLLYEIGGGAFNVPILRTALERLSAEQLPVEDLEFEQDSGMGKRTVLINARPVQRDGESQMLVAVEDITVQKQAERILFEEQERLKRSVQAGAAKLAQTVETLHTEAIGRKQAETALHESQAALLQNRGELRALTANLLQSQGEERRRVSRELHDDLSQKMAKLQFDVETLEQQLPSNFPQWKTGLLSIRDEVGALSNDIRRIAYQLHPSSLDHLGLSVALRSLCTEFAEREKLEVKFAVRNVPKRLPPDIASSLYRVAQEALRNVAKHAGTTVVDLTLAGGQGRLSLTIRDNGAGFDERSIRGNGGLGLISMQERVRLVNGEFSLKTRPGQGVFITIRVPLVMEKPQQ
jgi:two-component system CheB/CheR fusion protein